MFTIEKANKLLDIVYKEYPSLQDEAIHIKEGKEFSMQPTPYDNLVTIVPELPRDKFQSWMNDYLRKEYDLNASEMMYYNFNEVHAFLHEIGHIYYIDASTDYKEYKEKTYTSYEDAWRSYRQIEGEKLADKFASIVMHNQLFNIWALMNDITIEEAEEEYNFWKE